MKYQLSRLIITLLCAAYLIIPFKAYFLDSLHFVSHITLIENPFHQHSHSFDDHHHHHNLLEQISYVFNDHEPEHPIPALLLSYKFETALLFIKFKLPELIPLEMYKAKYSIILLKLAAPFYEVPTPPP